MPTFEVNVKRVLVERYHVTADNDRDAERIIDEDVYNGILVEEDEEDWEILSHQTYELPED